MSLKRDREPERARAERGSGGLIMLRVSELVRTAHGQDPATALDIAEPSFPHLKLEDTCAHP